MMYTGSFIEPENLSCYIGYTGCTKDVRIKRHIKESKESKKNTKKLNWLRANCNQVIQSFIIEDNIGTEKEALEKEVYYIRECKETQYGQYLKNGDDGGIGGTKNYSEETIEKIRASKIGNTWNIGRKKPEEEKRRASEARRGIAVAESTKKKLSEINKEKNRVKRENGDYSTNNSRKFSEEQVIDMFLMYNSGVQTKEIYTKYNCSYWTMRTVLCHPKAYIDWKIKNNLSVKQFEHRKNKQQ